MTSLAIAMNRVPLYLLEAASSSRFLVSSSAFRLASSTASTTVSGAPRAILSASTPLPSRELLCKPFCTVVTTTEAESEGKNASEEPKPEENDPTEDQKDPNGRKYPPVPDTIDGILSSIEERPPGVRAAADLTIKLSKLDFRPGSDHRFNRLLTIVSGPKTMGLHVSLLLSLHRALESMGVQGNAIPNTENALTWRLRQDSVSDLLHVMSYFFNRRGSDTGKKLFAELVATVERRWFEVEVRSKVFLM